MAEWESDSKLNHELELKNYGKTVAFDSGMGVLKVLIGHCSWTVARLLLRSCKVATCCYQNSELQGVCVWVYVLFVCLFGWLFLSFCLSFFLSFFLSCAFVRLLSSFRVSCFLVIGQQELKLGFARDVLEVHAPAVRKKGHQRYSRGPFWGLCSVKATDRWGRKGGAAGLGILEKRTNWHWMEMFSNGWAPGGCDLFCW